MMQRFRHDTMRITDLAINNRISMYFLMHITNVIVEHKNKNNKSVSNNDNNSDNNNNNTDTISSRQLVMSEYQATPARLARDVEKLKEHRSVIHGLDEVALPTLWKQLRM